jgi:hypothetical protein
LTIRSWPEALNAGGFSSACMMASSCHASPCVFPCPGHHMRSRTAARSTRITAFSDFSDNLS